MIDDPYEELNSNWFEFDGQAGKWSYQRTEDHIYAAYDRGGKRIGDMSREQLIEVIAIGYHEREQLARVLLCLVEGEELPAYANATIHLARLIMKKIQPEPALDKEADGHAADDC